VFVAPAEFNQFGAEHSRLCSAFVHDLHIDAEGWCMRRER
jgi:hypothetical protein